MRSDMFFPVLTLLVGLGFGTMRREICDKTRDILCVGPYQWLSSIVMIVSIVVLVQNLVDVKMRRTTWSWRQVQILKAMPKDDEPSMVDLNQDGDHELRDTASTDVVSTGDTCVCACLEKASQGSVEFESRFVESDRAITCVSPLVVSHSAPVGGGGVSGSRSRRAFSIQAALLLGEDERRQAALLLAQAEESLAAKARARAEDRQKDNVKTDTFL